MKKDICVLVGWQRPEFMTVCLEQIVKAERSEELKYIFALDEGHDPKYYDIIKDFPYESGIIKMHHTPYKTGKQSYNVLNAMIVAKNHTNKYIFYVEEDIFIGVDFFNFHYAVHEREKNLFCSIGTKVNDSEHKVTNNPAYYFEGNEHDYQSWGNCFNEAIIRLYIEQHFTVDYFTNPGLYCLKQFPDNYLKGNFCEQDGLTKRIMMKAGMRSIFPDVPRAYHAGFYGYNRYQARESTYEKRLEKVRDICFDPVKMEAACLPGYYKDSQPVDLTIKTTDYAKREKF